MTHGAHLVAHMPTQRPSAWHPAEDMKRFREWLIPELLREPDEARRLAAYRKTADKYWIGWATSGGLFCAILWTFAPTIFPSILAFLPMPSGAMGGTLMVLSILIVFFCAWMGLGTLLMRSRSRCGVRAYLRRQGVAICVSCGYDLTGNTSNVCPECGREVWNWTA